MWRSTLIGRSCSATAYCLTANVALTTAVTSLSRLVVSLIRVSGTTGVPEPPLRLDPDWLVAGLGVAALMLGALLVAEAASLAAFRDSRPERASWSLE